MDIGTLTAWLTEGLTPEQTAVVKQALERDGVKTKVATVKQAEEYNTLQTQLAELQLSMNGDAASGKLGAKAYQEWYDKNYPEVQKLSTRMAEYEKKFGTLEGAPPNPNPANPNPPASTITPEEIQRLVDKRFNDQFGPSISNVMATTGNIMQKHWQAGRKTVVNFDALAKTANEKFGGNLEAAYEDWDKPEREKLVKEDQEKEIKKRVDEELVKRGGTTYFPAAADQTPSTLGSRSKEVVDKFDKTAMQRDLVTTFLSGEAPTQ